MINLSERMRWQETPPSWAAVASALATRAQLLDQVAAAIAELPAGQLRDCLCDLAAAAAAAQDAGWNGSGGGPGGGPGGDGPGDGTNPGGWNDPNADPTTLLYQCHTFMQWEFYTSTTEGDYYYQIRMSDENAPPEIGTNISAYELQLSGGRWYAITPIVWPNGHTQMFPTFGQGDEDNPFTIGANETGTEYYFDPDINTSVFDLTLITKNPPPGGTGYQLCAAVPET